MQFHATPISKPDKALVGDEHGCPDLLISDLSWVQFDIIMGRIVAITNRAKQDRQRARRELPCGTSEIMAVSIDRGLTSLRYSLESEIQQLTIRVVRRDELEVRWTRRQPDGKRVTMAYAQAPEQNVRLSVRADDMGERVIEAPSLWHLAVADPEIRGIRMLAVLQALRPDWQLFDEADAIRAALLRTAPWQATTSVDEVRMLVSQMADRDFRVRQLADRALRARGRSVLCLLDELHPNQLESEQRLRVREIQRSLTGDGSDTPDRVAAWLVNDKRLWLALLKDSDSRNRLIALEHLVRIVDQPVAFDPAAAVAERSRQIAALRSQLIQRLR